MSDIREALARAIVRSSMCRGQEYIARRVADAILAEFLVVPRSDIQGYHYAMQYAPGHISLEDDQERVELLARLRGFVAVRRPLLPWEPIPEEVSDDA